MGWLLVVELRVESVGDDLGVGERPVGRPLPVLSARPVGLSHHEPQLTHLNIEIKIFVCEPKIYLYDSLTLAWARLCSKSAQRTCKTWGLTCHKTQNKQSNEVQCVRVPTLFLPGIWLDVPVSSSSQSSMVWCWASRSRPRSPVPSSRAANSGHSSTWAQGKVFPQIGIYCAYKLRHSL